MSAVPTALLFGILGLLFGSLASALSYRLPRGQKVLLDRSRCPACGVALAARDLVPLLSWIISGAKCRRCASPVSWRYPALELGLGIWFVLAFLLAHAEPSTGGLLALVGFTLAVIGLADWETRLIPDAMTIFLLALALAWRWHGHEGWLDGGLGMVVGFFGSWGLQAGFRRFRGKEGLGFGDVKLVGVAGLFVGLSGLGAFLVLSGVLGILIGLAWRWSGRGAAFPFGPALCLSLLSGIVLPLSRLASCPVFVPCM